MSEKLRHYEHLNFLIKEKRKRLPEGAVILKPGDIDPTTAAGAMTELLSAVYGRHNLLPSVEHLASQVQSEKVLPWFIEEQNHFVACAALIVHEGRVEIGRAANHPEFGHNGSLLMLEAVAFHQQNFRLPLVAEIRLADNFEGIIGGQPSQVTLLKHVGMRPFAIMPAFHHPGPRGPDRQEFFCFCADQRPSQPNHLFISKNLWQSSLIRSLKDSIFPFTEVILVNPGELPEFRFQVDRAPPFNTLQTEPKGLPLEEAMLKMQKPFTLATVPLDVKNSPVAEFLLREGYIPCGFDWRTPALLMGQLKSGVILAPVGLAAGCLKEDIQMAILKLEGEFKKQTETS